VIQIHAYLGSLMVLHFTKCSVIGGSHMKREYIVFNRDHFPWKEGMLDFQYLKKCPTEHH
jgi:hypothetical protein